MVDIDGRCRFTYGELRSMVDGRLKIDIILWSISSTTPVVYSPPGKYISQKYFTDCSVRIFKSCYENFVHKNSILRTRSCGTAFISQHNWLLHFHQAEICLVEMICTTVVQASKGPALKYFYMIHRGGWHAKRRVWPPAPMNHVKIFKGWPLRDAPSELVQL